MPVASVSGGRGKSWNGGHVERRRREGGGADGVGFEEVVPLPNGEAAVLCPLS